MKHHRQLIIFIFFLTILSACSFSPSAKTEKVFQGLFWGADLTRVTSDLFFPKQVDGVSLSWSSNNEEVIDNQGHVFRAEGDVTVVIDVVLEYQGYTDHRQLLVTVLKRSFYPISKAKSIGDQKTVTVNGTVIGTVGHDAYLHDGRDGILVKNIGDVELGAFLLVTGIKQVINGQLQLLFVEKTVDENIDFVIKSQTIADFTLLNQVNDMVTIESVTMIVKESSYSSDVRVELINQNQQSMELLIRATHANYQTLIEQIAQLPSNNRVHLHQVIVSSLNPRQVEFVQESSLESLNINLQAAFYPEPGSVSLLEDLLIETEITAGLPSLNDVHALIIPVEFADYSFTQVDLERLELAFFGTAAETGWESVQSYYQQSSYGKLQFNGTVLPPFQTHRLASYYSRLFKKGIDADYEIVKAALEYYDSQIDYSEYDRNNDGYIDALYFIYAAPVNFKGSWFSLNNVDLWWAYVYQYLSDDYEYYDGVEANYYLWAGLDFINEPLIDEGNNKQMIPINASTYIHETGHMFGLDDYYDYNEFKGPDGGLGGADMMDYTVGDHNPFSKIILGWTTPLVVTEESVTVTLRPFSESGDVIMINPSWENSYFDEYLLIDFYVPSFLNEAHAGYRGLFSESGIRIFHVDATADPKQGSPQNENGYYSVFSFNNSDTDHKLIKLIEADGNYSIEKTGVADNADLYRPGDIFGKTSYPGYRWYDRTLINFTVEIISISDDEAIIMISFK
ncbi:MAG TPA: hypothetical protein PK087_01055 [Bacilli bacterium]|nr:MAG: hypothetical protein BWY97_00280 [Tenericutes bacterium ADurb.BinA124]HOH17888.1 hypothetical protein [Bacilli bacterium]HPX83756.1 hypothetical protein [Bacilli bacterium]HQC73941.1 hypothetical protein [Bacilli bacterium]